MKRINCIKTTLIIFSVFLIFFSLNVSAKSGWVTVKGKKYYYKQNVKVKGYQTIDNKIYYFAFSNGSLRKGWQKTSNGLFYSKKNGEVARGWTTIKGKKYYFNTNYPYNAYVGNQTINGNKYYFYYSGVLRTGWQKTSKGIFYSNSNGVINTGWQTINNKKYYFNPSYPYNAYVGYHNIDGDMYYFYYSGALRTGFQRTKTATYYSDENGLVKTGWQIINGKEYYFDTKYPYNAYRGYHMFDDKNWFFSPDGMKCTGKVMINGNAYYFTEDGEFIRVQYIPKYYSQKDSRWRYKKYGKLKFGATGCTPTSIAMAYTSLLGREVLPTEIGNYLYNKTNQFNKSAAGCHGKAVIYAGNKYGIRTVPITSVEQLQETLQNGNIVYAAMQKGKFATKDWNHAIVLYSYNNGNTYAYDPLNTKNNGYVSLSLIWNQKSKDKDDTSGGSALYSLQK